MLEVSGNVFRVFQKRLPSWTGGAASVIAGALHSFRRYPGGSWPVQLCRWLDSAGEGSAKGTGGVHRGALCFAIMPPFARRRSRSAASSVRPRGKRQTLVGIDACVKACVGLVTEYITRSDD